MHITFHTAPLEPTPIEQEPEVFHDAVQITEVKSEGTFVTNSHQH